MREILDNLLIKNLVQNHFLLCLFLGEKGGDVHGSKQSHQRGGSSASRPAGAKLEQQEPTWMDQAELQDVTLRWPLAGNLRDGMDTLQIREKRQEG